MRPAFALRRTVTAAGARLRDDVRAPYPHEAFSRLIETVRLPLCKPERHESGNVLRRRVAEAYATRTKPLPPEKPGLEPMVVTENDVFGTILTR